MRLKNNLAMSAYQYFDIQQNHILLTCLSLPALLTSKLKLLSDQKSKELPYSEVCFLFRHSRASHALILQMQSLRLSLFLVSLSTESLNHCDNYFLMLPGTLSPLAPFSAYFTPLLMTKSSVHLSSAHS